MIWDLRIIYAKILNIFSSPPKKYWPLLLLAALFLILATTFLNVYFFWLWSQPADSLPVLPQDPGERAPKINQAALEKTIESIEDREQQFQKEFQKPGLGDPSL
ncbi:MAG: hypothetical protein AAB474_01265 [Patescibacteria group bacterium]